MLGALDTELIDRQPLVGLHIRPVDQAHEIATRLAVLLILNRHTADQQAMKQAVGGQLNRYTQLQHLTHRILTSSERYTGVQPRNRCA